MTEPAPDESPLPAADGAPSLSLFRSAFAVVSGVVAYIVLLTLFMTSVGALFPTLYQKDPFGPQSDLALSVSLLGELLNGAAVGLLASRVAGRAPLAHAGVLAGVLGLFAMAGMDQVTGRPAWFALGFATCGPLGVLLGGLLGRRVLGARRA